MTASVTSIITRGQVWLADLGTPIGSEQGGMRPVLIISNNKNNMYSTTLTVVPLTSKQSKNKIPTHVSMNGEDYLTETSVALVEQVRTIDKVRLGKMLGVVSNNSIMIEIDEAIRIQNGLKQSFSYQKAYIILDKIVSIGGIIKKTNDPTLKDIKLFLITQFKEYCAEHNIDFNVVKEQYKMVKQQCK